LLRAFSLSAGGSADGRSSGAVLWSASFWPWRLAASLTAGGPLSAGGSADGRSSGAGLWSPLPSLWPCPASFAGLWRAAACSCPVGLLCKALMLSRPSPLSLRLCALLW